MKVIYAHPTHLMGCVRSAALSSFSTLILLLASASSSVASLNLCTQRKGDVV